MESSDFCLVISQQSLLSSYHNTLAGAVFPPCGPAPQPHHWTHLLTACPHAVTYQGTDRPPEFPGFPCQHARLSDTGRSNISGQLEISVLSSAAIKTSTPTVSHFGAQSPWPIGSLSTLNPQRHRWRPKTRFRVVTSLARVGLAPTRNQRTVSIKQTSLSSNFPCA